LGLNIVACTRILGGSKSTKINSGRGLALDPTGGAYSTPPDLLAPKNYTTRLGHPGLAPPSPSILNTDRRRWQMDSWTDSSLRPQSKRSIVCHCVLAKL